ncbi:MAG: FMN-binding protein, partial [Candidatus Zixiibacteriota bacterium]
MKRVIKYVAIGTVIAAFGIHLKRSAPQADAKGELESLKIVMPQANLFSEKKGQPPHYEAYKEEKDQKKLIGLCFTTTDVVPEERGYSGPIKIMIGMDLEGRITGIKILHHTETPSYVRELKSAWFSDQFKGKSIADRFKVNEDIDGITRATITAEAVARAVKKSGRKVGRDVLNLHVVEAEEEGYLSGFAKIEIFILGSLFAVAAVGFIKKSKRLRYSSLIVALIFLGFAKSSPVSMVHIASILSFNLPILTYNIFWYLLIGLMLVTTSLRGRLYCGWICPFGSVTELLNKVKTPKLNISERIDKKAKSIKYIILWLLIIFSLILNNVNVSNYEPFSTLFNLSGGLGF